MRTIANGLNVLINSLNKLFGEKQIYLFSRESRSFINLFKKKNKLKIVKNDYELFSIISKVSKNRRIALIIGSKDLVDLKEKYGLNNLLVLFRGVIIISIGNDCFLNAFSDILNNNGVIMVPSFLFEIPISLEIAKLILESSRDSLQVIFISLSTVLLNLYEEVELEQLELDINSGLSNNKILSFKNNGLNFVLENNSRYVILSTGFAYRTILSYLFERNKLSSFSLIKLGVLSQESIREVLELIRDKDYIIVLNELDFLKTRIEKQVLESFYKGELNRIPIMISDRDLNLIPDNDVLIAIEELINNIDYASKLWETFTYNDYRVVYPIEPSLIALTFFIKALSVNRNFMLMMPSKLSRIIEVPSKISVVLFKRLVDLVPVLFSIEKSKDTLIVLVLLNDLIPDSSIDFDFFNGLIDLVLFIKIRSNEPSTIEKLIKASKREFISIKNPSDLKYLINKMNNSDVLLRKSVISIELKDDYRGDIAKIYINEDKCVKCDDCMIYTRCPALTKKVNGLIFIDSIMCSRCGLCSFACRYDAINIIKSR